MKTCTTSDGTTSTTTSNQYNAEGQRVRKGGSTYLYDGDKVVLELDGYGNQAAQNVYGLNLLTSTAGTDTFKYMYNGHGDTTALLNASGAVAAIYYYDAFGNITDTTGTVNNNFTYAGYFYDKETGMYYLNARMYDPKLARFVQRDTYLGQDDDPLSLNLYTYCANNPLIYDDPSGYAYTSYRKTWDQCWEQTFKQEHRILGIRQTEYDAIYRAHQGLDTLYPDAYYPDLWEDKLDLFYKNGNNDVNTGYKLNALSFARLQYRYECKANISGAYTKYEARKAWLRDSGYLPSTSTASSGNSTGQDPGGQYGGIYDIATYLKNRYGGEVSYNSSKILTVAKFVMSDLDSGGICSLTAITRVIDYYKNKYTNIDKDYKTIYNKVLTKGKQHGFTYDGGTNPTKIDKIVQEVLWDYGYKNSNGTNDYAWSFNSDVKDETDANKPVIMNIARGYYKNHSVTVNGYAIYYVKKKVYGITVSYKKPMIAIYDGWKGAQRYIDYNAFAYDLIHAGIGSFTRVKVKA